MKFISIITVNFTIADRMSSTPNLPKSFKWTYVEPRKRSESRKKYIYIYIYIYKFLSQGLFLVCLCLWLSLSIFWCMYGCAHNQCKWREVVSLRDRRRERELVLVMFWHKKRQKSCKKCWKINCNFKYVHYRNCFYKYVLLARFLNMKCIIMLMNIQT